MKNQPDTHVLHPTADGLVAKPKYRWVVVRLLVVARISMTLIG